MSVGVTKDYKLKVRNLRASHTVHWVRAVKSKKKKHKKSLFFSSFSLKTGSKAYTFRNRDMSTFEAFREVTGWVRPTHDHGCKPCQIVPV